MLIWTVLPFCYLLYRTVLDASFVFNAPSAHVSISFPGSMPTPRTFARPGPEPIRLDQPQANTKLVLNSSKVRLGSTSFANVARWKSHWRDLSRRGIWRSTLYLATNPQRLAVSLH